MNQHKCGLCILWSETICVELNTGCSFTVAFRGTGECHVSPPPIGPRNCHERNLSVRTLYLWKPFGWWAVGRRTLEMGKPAMSLETTVLGGEWGNSYSMLVKCQDFKIIQKSYLIFSIPALPVLRHSTYTGTHCLTEPLVRATAWTTWYW